MFMESYKLTSIMKKEKEKPQLKPYSNYWRMLASKQIKISEAIDHQIKYYIAYIIMYFNCLKSTIL